MISITMNNFRKVCAQVHRRFLNAEVNYLKQVKYFGLLKKSALNKIAAAMTVKTLHKDNYIFREGDPAHWLYIVSSGEVEIIKGLNERKPLHAIETLEDSAKVYRTEQLNHIFKAPKGLKKSALSICLAG